MGIVKQYCIDRNIHSSMCRSHHLPFVFVAIHKYIHKSSSQLIELDSYAYVLYSCTACRLRFKGSILKSVFLCVFLSSAKSFSPLGKGENRPELHHDGQSSVSSLVIAQSCQCLLQSHLEAIHHRLSWCTPHHPVWRIREGCTIVWLVKGMGIFCLERWAMLWHAFLI